MQKQISPKEGHLSPIVTAKLEDNGDNCHSCSEKGDFLIWTSTPHRETNHERNKTHYKN